ncbi:MAG: hypothetical protein A2020_04490 [Lentisphaerae bacterium GWF2_45_14]|nr:MAG: hypothetical protein A2020_04490 [Lentisphaerae bacterium GWF2_45_14]
MNIRSELFLAWRYLRPKRNAISVITCISIVGVSLGVAVLIIVLSVMTGFTDLMKEKILETTAHLQIHSYVNYQNPSGAIKNPSAAIKKMKECGIEGAPVVYSQVLAQSKDSFFPKAIIGIDPANTGRINLKDTMKYGEYSLEKGEVLISQVTAKQLDVSVGDKILLHSPNKLSKMVNVKKGGGIDVKKASEVYLPDEFTVKGIYSFDKYDFDKMIIFMNLDDADDIVGLPWGACTMIYGWVKDPFNMSNEIKELAGKLPDMYVRSWADINQKLLGVLSVEKNMMFFLLIFIVIVAAFSIANTLITVVIQKTREVGLLKALGATSGGVMRIFVLQGFLVGVIGTFSGTIMGFLVIHFRNDLMRFVSRNTGMELFPKEFYFFNELPAHIVAGDVAWIAVVSIILCTFGALIPAWRAAILDPARSLRYE